MPELDTSLSLILAQVLTLSFSPQERMGHVPAAPLWVLSLIILRFLFCDTLSFSTLHVWDNIWFSHHSLKALVPVLKWCFSSLYVHFSFFYHFPLFLKNLFIFNWKIIALQYCAGFCHTTMWISQRYTYVWAFWVMLVVKNYPANPGDVREAGSISAWDDLLEEGTAVHSSILAWRIPQTEEPSEQQFIELQRVGLDWSDLVRTHIYTYTCPLSLEFYLFFTKSCLIPWSRKSHVSCQNIYICYCRLNCRLIVSYSFRLNNKELSKLNEKETDDPVSKN